MIARGACSARRAVDRTADRDYLKTTAALKSRSAWPGTPMLNNRTLMTAATMALTWRRSSGFASEFT
jgi:hypothetical protein